MKHLTLWVTCFFISMGLAFAQNRHVFGTVVDGNGKPVIGASVIAKENSAIGTATSKDGQFMLSLPPSITTLVVKYLGMKSVEVKVGENLQITLHSAEETLEEVMVVAYGGKTKKVDFVGSAAVVTAQKIEKRPITNIISALEGATAGIQMTSASGQPGSAASIRIRGISSINAGNDPLFVVDGMAYPSGSSSINPNDIESITLLKDAASTSLYGARAANGVVLITTKSGKYLSGQSNLKVNLRVTQGAISRGLPEYDRVGAFDYIPLEWEAYRNGLVYTSNIAMDVANQRASGLVAGQNGIMDLLLNNPFNVPNNQVIGTDGVMNPSAKLLYNDFDWYGAMSRKGYRSDYTLAISDATEKSDYYASIGYMKENGFVTKTDFDRMTGRANMNVRPVKWFATGFNLNGTIGNATNQAGTANTGYTNVFFFARNIGPIYPIYKHDDKGDYVLDGFNQKIYQWDKRGPGASSGRHIVAETEWNSNSDRRSVLGAKAYIDLTPLKGLTLSIKGGYDYRGNWTEASDNPRVGDGAPSGRARRETSLRDGWTFQQLLTYNTKINDEHSINVLLGHESYSEKYSYIYGFKQGLIIDGNTELINYTTINSLYSFSNEYKQEGYFSKLEYNYKSKYYLQGSYRRDGSSKFSPDVRWGDFFSAGLSWRISQENFFKADWVNDLKVRASYGEVGNDNISWYPWQALYDLSRNRNEGGFIKSSIGNKKLKWETNQQFDAAIEYDLFSGRLNGSVEYFRRGSKDLLFDVPLPNSSSGLTTVTQNIGNMYNLGVEVQLNGDIIRKQDFYWNLGLNLTTSKNKITKLPQEKISASPFQREVGYSIYEFYLRQYVGVNPQNGMPMYLADPELATATNSYEYEGKTVVENPANGLYRYCGNAFPDFYGSINNTLTYKNLSLSLLCTYSVGGKGYDNTYSSLMTSGNSYGAALHVDVLNRWRKEGDITNVPRMDAGTASSYINAASSRWLIDQSYFNIRSATLACNIPKHLLRQIDMKDISVYLSGENLKLFSKRKGYNPQERIDSQVTNTYSFSRIYSIGLNINF